MKTFTPLFLIWILFAPSLVAGGRFLKGSDEDEGSNDGAKASADSRSVTKRLDGPQERECDFSAGGKEVEFECKSKTDKEKGSSTDGDETISTTRAIITPQNMQDKISYKVKTTGDGVTMDLKYKQEIDMVDDGETETKTTFKLEFTELIEYVKRSNSSDSEAYEWDMDEIVQTIPLSEWSDLSDVTNEEGGVVSYFSATTALGEEDEDEEEEASTGSVMFKFTLSRQDVAAETLLKANSMKIDVRITDFPWMRSDSYLALMSTVESQKKVKMDYDDTAETIDTAKSKRTNNVVIAFDDGMEAAGFTTFGEYTWAQDAQVLVDTTGASNLIMDKDMDSTVSMARQSTMNGTDVMMAQPTTTIQVIATSPPSLGNETYQAITFSFVGDAAHEAADIYWDPEAGIGYEESDSAAATTPDVSMNSSAAGIVVPSLFAIFGGMAVGLFL